MMNMIETPEEAFSRPDVLARRLWVLYRSKDYKRRHARARPARS
jgi:hypothetical protein